LDLDLSRLLLLQFLSCSCVSLQAGRALNICPIRCTSIRLLSLLWDATLEVGTAYLK